MVKLKDKVKLAESIEPYEGGTFKITAVEEVKTAVQGYSGIRVVMQSTKKGEEDKEFATMLWLRERAGASSKLGAFIAAFKDFYGGDEEAAYDTDNWINHVVRFVSWKPREREIRIIE